MKIRRHTQSPESLPILHFYPAELSSLSFDDLQLSDERKREFLQRLAPRQFFDFIPGRQQHRAEQEMKVLAQKLKNMSESAAAQEKALLFDANIQKRRLLLEMVPQDDGSFIVRPGARVIHAIRTSSNSKDVVYNLESVLQTGFQGQSNTPNVYRTSSEEISQQNSEGIPEYFSWATASEHANTAGDRYAIEVYPDIDTLFAGNPRKDTYTLSNAAPDRISRIHVLIDPQLNKEDRKRREQYYREKFASYGKPLIFRSMDFRR